MLVYSKPHSRLVEDHVKTHIGWLRRILILLGVCGRIKVFLISTVPLPRKLGNASCADYFLKLKVIR